MPAQLQGESVSGAEGDVAKEAAENLATVEADAAAAAAMAVARAEAYESVDFKDEEAGGSGTAGDKTQMRELRALLQRSVLEHGVGGWAAKVRARGDRMSSSRGMQDFRSREPASNFVSCVRLITRAFVSG